MRKSAQIIIGLAVIGLVIWALVFAYNNLRGIGPAIGQSSREITEVLRNLKVADGFKVEAFASNLSSARVMLEDSLGNIWVSRTKDGIISLLEIEDGQVVGQSDIFENLNKPHGLTLDPDDPFILYIAETDKISRVRIYSEGEPETVLDIEGDGRHFSRTIKFGPDKRLYLSVGSTCNVCEESTFWRAKIFSMNKDGSGLKEYAWGLRNSVFFDWNPIDGEMWATEMGRDLLGDDLPPDEINIVREGKNYGWPTCYGKNIHDTDYDKNIYIRNPCMSPFENPSHIDIPAHSSPLGLGFIPEEGWPETHWYDLLVSYHGSWNRTEPTGYKIVRHKLDAAGNYLGVEDFISGWLKKGEALGRPVDILIKPGGFMYISDDKAGAIYKVTADSDSEVPAKTKKRPSSIPVDLEVLNLEKPAPNSVITSPLEIKGEALGIWFFEGDFPIHVLDANDRELGVGIAKAIGNWMTVGHVPFEAEVIFDTPFTATGKLVFEKDNPTGFDEHDEKIIVPIKFR